MSNRKSFVFNILFLVFSVLFIISLVRTMSGEPALTFAGFLENLSSAPQITISGFIDLTIVGDWGFFEFFRSFLNFFTSALSLLIYIASNLINLLMLVGWSLKFFFLG